MTQAERDKLVEAATLLRTMADIAWRLGDLLPRDSDDVALLIRETEMLLDLLQARLVGRK